MSATPAPEPETASAPVDEPNTAAQLAERFPALFSGTPKPIKLRIHADIQERAPGVFTKQALSAFFRRYTGSGAYLIALTKATQRYDLDGQPVGELSDEHRQIAQQELARRRANRESRQALEEQQRYNRAMLLRDFERTTLTPANFCALKGVAPEELDGLLARAREEAQEARQQRPPPQGRPPQGRPPHEARPQEARPNEARPHGPRPRPGGRDNRPRGSAGPGGPGGRGGRPPR